MHNIKNDSEFETIAERSEYLIMIQSYSCPYNSVTSPACPQRSCKRTMAAKETTMPCSQETRQAQECCSGPGGGGRRRSMTIHVLRFGIEVVLLRTLNSVCAGWLHRLRTKLSWSSEAAPSDDSYRMRPVNYANRKARTSIVQKSRLVSQMDPQTVDAG